MSPGVLACMSCCWLRVVARSVRGYFVFVEVCAWGSVFSGNVSAICLIFLLMFLVLVCDILDGFSFGPVIL